MFGPASPSPMPLEVLRGAERDTRAPVAEREQRHLVALEQLLDHDLAAEGRRRRAARRRPRRCVRHTNTPLPAASPSALTTHGASRDRTASPRSARRRAAITSLAKVFDPSIRAAAALGPKTAIPFLPQARRRRPRRAAPPGPITTRSAASVVARLEQAVAVVGANRVAVPERRDPGVARRRVELGQDRALREAPRERVLARARADEQHLHAARILAS